MIEIDWRNAPEWANYHAYEEDGVGYWFQKKPYKFYGIWKNEGKFIESGYTITNWQETLTCRPAAQNK
jgi:hypothetical protein